MLRQLFYAVGCLSVGTLLGSLLSRSLVAAPVLTLPQDIIGCPADMVRAGPVCIDKYEASVWDSGAGTGTQYGAATDNYPCSDTGNDCSDPAQAAKKIYAVSRICLVKYCVSVRQPTQIPSRVLPVC